MSEAIKEVYKNNPEISERISKTKKKKFKYPEIRKRNKRIQKQVYQNSELRENKV
jgi:hypothetical protein